VLTGFTEIPVPTATQIPPQKHLTVWAHAQAASLPAAQFS